MAERYCSQLEIVNVGIYAYEDGFVYELQEGGDGRGYFPALLRKKQRESEDESSTVLRAGERLVKIVLKPGALQCLLLPTETDALAEEVEPSGPMSPLENLNYGFLMAASILFVSGFSALLVTGLLFRYQPPRPPKPIPHRQQTAIEYWNSTGIHLFERMPSSQYLAAMRFDNGRWGLSFASVPAPSAGTPAASSAEVGKAHPATSLSTTVNPAMAKLGPYARAPHGPSSVMPVKAPRPTPAQTFVHVRKP
jgi:hypothetical protein